MTKKSDKIEFISVVVPVYNEEGCLQELIDRTLAALDNCHRRFEFILVDDGSRDSSAEIMKAASAKRPDEVVSCLLNRNYGQHSAIMEPSGMSGVIRLPPVRCGPIPKSIWSNTISRHCPFASLRRKPFSRRVDDFRESEPGRDNGRDFSRNRVPARFRSSRRGLRRRSR